MKKKIHWLAYKQQKFISHNSGGWEVLDQGTSSFLVWWGPASWLTEVPSYCIFTWQRQVRGFSPTSFTKLIRRAPLFWSNQFVKALLPNTIVLGVKMSNYGLGGDTNILTITILITIVLILPPLSPIVQKLFPQTTKSSPLLPSH